MNNLRDAALMQNLYILGAISDYFLLPKLQACAFHPLRVDLDSLTLFLPGNDPSVMNCCIFLLCLSR